MQDLQTFGRLGIRTVFDLRTEAERQAEPDRLPDGTQLVVCDVLADSQQTAPAELESIVTDPSVADRVLGGGRAEALFEQAYRDIVSLPSALTAYRRMFTSLLDDAHRPALLHCTTGKDRTGWGAAATLTLLGVSEADVRADYMITNRDLLPALKPYFDRFAAAGGDAGAADARARRREPVPRRGARRAAQPLRDDRELLRARPRHRRRAGSAPCARSSSRSRHEAASGPESGPPDDHAPGGRAPAHLDGLGRLRRSLGGGQLVADPAGVGAHVEPGGRCLRGCRPRRRPAGSRARPSRARPRPAARRRWRTSRSTPARATPTAMLPLAALIRRSPPAAPTHVSPLEFLITAPASSSRQADVARAGGDLGVPGRVLGADVADAGLEVQRAGPIEPDAAEAGLDPAVAEATVAVEVRQLAGAADMRAGGQLDRHVDRSAGAPGQPRAQLRRLDEQLPVGVLDARLRGDVDVLLAGCVAGTHVDDGDAAVAGLDADLPDGRPRSWR